MNPTTPPTTFPCVSGADNKGLSGSLDQLPWCHSLVFCPCGAFIGVVRHKDPLLDGVLKESWCVKCAAGIFDGFHNSARVVVESEVSLVPMVSFERHGNLVKATF
jgi:hypothetical protein